MVCAVHETLLEWACSTRGKIETKSVPYREVAFVGCEQTYIVKKKRHKCALPAAG